MLSKKEEKYRIKFIQQHNLKKSIQRCLDKAIKNIDYSYKYLYKLPLESQKKYISVYTILYTDKIGEKLM